MRRAYVTAAVRVRLHQRAFRERVLGEPLVCNGLSLCTLHHAAFDRCFVGLRPDYVIEVRSDIRRERDGPTLVHAIQALHGTRIVLPGRKALRPDPALVEIRYEQFRERSPGPLRV